VLDETTSAQYGGSTTSAVVTYALNPNAMSASWSSPFWPFYTGSQTVYYNRITPSIATTSSILSGNIYNLNVDSGGFQIPLGSALGTTIVTTHDLLLYLQPGIASGIDMTDIELADLPTAYGDDGTVAFNLTFSGSYMVTDGALPLVFTQTGPDMSVIVGTTTDFPASAIDGNWVNYIYNSKTNLQSTSIDISLLVLNWWISTYSSNIGSTDAANWTYLLTASVVEGSLQATDADTAAAHSGCGFQAMIEVTAPWGASFQQQIYFDKIDLSSIYAASNGVLTVDTDTQMFGQPMRIIDWITSGGLQFYEDASGYLSYYLSNYVIWTEFSNLHDLVLPDENGNLSFTLTAPEGSTIQENSLQVVIVLNNTLPAAPTAIQLLNNTQSIPVVEQL
jgi:hypothetical protein